MADWTVQVTAPNGATGQLTAADGEDQSLVDQFTAFLGTVRENDIAPIEALQGQPAQTQPVRQAMRKA